MKKARYLLNSGLFRAEAVSVVGRGRLELPTNGLKARCGAHCKRESAHEKSRQIRTICPVRVKIPRTFAIRGFDSLHPLHPSPCHTGHFPSERNVQPPTHGRDRGGFFTFF